MHPLLKTDKKNIAAILNQATDIALNYLSNQENLPPSRDVRDIPALSIPQEGFGATKTLDYFRAHFAHRMTNSAGSRYFGFVTGGATPAAVSADWLVSAFDQNACGSHDSAAPLIEHQTINLFKELFHLDSEYFGTFVTGATISNFVSLALGRQWVGQQRGIDIAQDGLTSTTPIKVVSATPHSSIIKSLAMSGLGRNAWVKIPTLPDREAIDIDALAQYLSSNPEPCILVANAGTVNTVDFDDLKAIGQLKQKYNFWLHVDAAFGGFAACSDKFKHLTEGINQADSITIDAHKWLNVPYDAAMQFTRHKKLQLAVFQNSAAYLGDPEQSPDFFHYTPENSRRFRALPSWFNLVAYGRDGLREMVERNCDVAHYLGERITKSESLRLLAPVRMNVVCFTLKGDVTPDIIRNYLQAIRDDGQVFFTPTIYKGTPGIRAAISNWQTERRDIDVAMSVLEGVGVRQ